MVVMMMMMMMKDKQHIIEDEIKKAHVRFLSLYGIVLNLGVHAFQISYLRMSGYTKSPPGVEHGALRLCKYRASHSSKLCPSVNRQGRKDTDRCWRELRRVLC
jgi:hypothetical protein